MRECSVCARARTRDCIRLMRSSRSKANRHRRCFASNGRSAEILWLVEKTLHYANTRAITLSNFSQKSVDIRDAMDSIDCRINNCCPNAGALWKIRSDDDIKASESIHLSFRYYRRPLSAQSWFREAIIINLMASSR